MGPDREGVCLGNLENVNIPRRTVQDLVLVFDIAELFVDHSSGIRVSWQQDESRVALNRE